MNFLRDGGTDFVQHERKMIGRGKKEHDFHEADDEGVAHDRKGQRDENRF